MVTQNHKNTINSDHCYNDCSVKIIKKHPDLTAAGHERGLRLMGKGMVLIYKGECGLSPHDLLLADHTVFIDRLKHLCGGGRGGGRLHRAT